MSNFDSTSRHGDFSQQFAIIGHACRFPGGANDAVSLWQLLANGMDACTEIPMRCFDVDAVYTDAADRSSSGFRRMGVRNASVIQDADCFDAAFFNISRREARVMDPQQRQLLQVAHEAVEVSGYCPTSPTPSTDPAHFAVYVAAATDDYVANLASQEVDVFYSPATLRAFLAGRISHHFGWEGPSLVVDTACSSSLVALHTACRAIASDDCRSALVCGVNVITSPLTMLGLYRGHFLSKDGRCKTFDASADGYGRAEGVAAFVVKSLQDALDDGDHIEAVIRASAMNQSGLAKSITHPDRNTQMKLFQRIHCDSGVPPSQVSYIEMHGTGTKAGDRCEMSSVAAIYGSGDEPLHVGSVKANMGHAEAAAGFAGLAKVLGMFRNRQIPPQISLKTLNPELEPFVGESRITISTRATQWNTSGSDSRFALVNSFGAAGSNASVLLQEWDGIALPRYLTSAVAVDAGMVFCLSTKSRDALVKLFDGFVDYIEQAATDARDNVSVARVCYATAARRIHHRGHRWALPVDPSMTLAAFVEALKQARPSVLEAPKLPAQSPALFVLLPDDEQLAPSAMWEQSSKSPLLDSLLRAVLTDLGGAYASQVLAVIEAKDMDALVELPAHLGKILAFAFEVALVRQWQQLSVTSLHLLARRHGSHAVAQHALGNVPVETAYAEWLASDGTAADSTLLTLRGAPASLIPAGSLILSGSKVAMATEPTLASASMGLLAQADDRLHHEILAFLWEAGLPMDFARAFQHSARANLPLLPLHPFGSERYWVPYENMQRQSAQADNGTAVQNGACDPAYVPQESQISLAAHSAYPIEPYSHLDGKGLAYSIKLTSVREEIMGHLVAGRGMCPASVYHELAFTSAAASLGRPPGAFAVTLRNGRYTTPLVYDDVVIDPGRLVCHLVPKELDVPVIAPASASTFSVCVSSYKEAAARAPPTQHFVGEVTIADIEAPEPAIAASYRSEADAIMANCDTSRAAPLETATLYAHFASKVVAYSPMYQTIESFQCSENGFEAVATLTAGKLVPTNADGRPWSLNPILQDTMLHACGYLAHTCLLSVEGVVFIAQSLGELQTLGETAVLRACQARRIAVRTVWDESRSSLVCKALALDSRNEVVAVIEGLVFRRLNQRALSAALLATTPQSANSLPGNSLSRSDLRGRVLEIIAQGTSLPSSKIEGSLALEELGVDSLLFIEILAAIGRLLPARAASAIGEELSPTDTVDALVSACEGKVDDMPPPALIPHDAAATPHRTPVSGDEVCRAAMGVLAKVLGFDEIQLQENRTSSLADLGLDSLGAIELAEGLATRLDIGRDGADAYAACESLDNFLEGVCKKVRATRLLNGGHAALTDPDQSTVQSHMLPNKGLQGLATDSRSAPTERQRTIYDQLQPLDVSFLRRALRMDSNPTLIRRGTHGSVHAPVFFCADGSGVAASVLSLPQTQVRDIWTLDHADFLQAPEERALTIVEHAAILRAAITAAYPDGPLIMAGWSFGGVLAWEIAHQLRSVAGREVLGTVAIDSPCPLGHTPLDAAVIDSLIPPAANPSHATGEEAMVKTVRELMRASFYKAAAAMAAYGQESRVVGEDVKSGRTALQAALTKADHGSANQTTGLLLALLRSEDDYRPGNELQRMALAGSDDFAWLTRRTSSGRDASASLGWEKVGAGLDLCLAIPGSHFTPFARRNVGAVSDALEQCCAHFESPRGAGQR